MGLLMRGSWIPNYCHRGHRFLNYCVFDDNGAGADDVSDILLQCDVLNQKLFGINRINDNCSL